MTSIQKNNFEKDILQALDTGFRDDRADWMPSFLLMSKLLQKSGREIIRNGIEIRDVGGMLQKLQSKGLVEYSPTYQDGIYQGFTTRLTARGYNMVHYGKPTLVG
jgi:hypothetical protein